MKIIRIKELGRRLTFAFNNPMETAYLFQRLSIVLRRFTAVCVLGFFGGKQDNY